MAKDPATLFYWNDWFTGTLTFSRHLKGCYMDLLTAQFNNGHLTMDEIKTVLGNDFAAWQGALSKKFVQDDAGLFFNEKLDDTIKQRREYSKKQSDRVKSRWNKSPGNDSGNTTVYTVVLPNKELELGNEIKDEINKGGAGGKVLDGPLFLKSNSSALTPEYIERELSNAGQWKESCLRSPGLIGLKLPDIDRYLKLFIAEITSTCEYESYKGLNEAKRHFVNWTKKQLKNKPDESTQSAAEKAKQLFRNGQK